MLIPPPSPPKKSFSLVLFFSWQKKNEDWKKEKGWLHSHSKETKDKSKLDMNRIHQRIHKEVAEFKNTAMQKKHFFKKEKCLSSRIPKILLQSHSFVQKPSMSETFPTIPRQLVFNLNNLLLSVDHRL